MATIQRRDPTQELSLHLCDATADADQCREAIRTSLRNLGMETRLLRGTHDAGRFFLDLVQDRSAIGILLYHSLSLWLLEGKGRRTIEIPRHALTVKAPSAKELKQVLEALENYDRLSFIVYTSDPAKCSHPKAPDETRR